MSEDPKTYEDWERRLREETIGPRHPSRHDGTDRLCLAVYGRESRARDYIGGSEARMLHDAADLIERLHRELAARAEESCRIAGPQNINPKRKPPPCESDSPARETA